MSDLQSTCSTCQTRYPSTLFTECPHCGGASEQVGSAEPAGMDLSFAIVQCDQGHVFPLGKLTECPECGEVLDLVDENVGRRVDAYSDDIARLKERLDLALASQFAKQGSRDAPATFASHLSSVAFTLPLEWADTLVASMAAGEWSKPDDPTTIDEWNRIQGTVNDVIDLIVELKELLSPPLLIAYHRLAVRTVERFAEAFILFISALTARSIEDAHDIKGRAQAALDASGHTATRSGELLSPITGTIDRNLNLVEASLELASNRTASRAFAVTALPEVARIANVDPSMLSPVYPMLLPIAALHDSERRADRMGIAYRLLQRAEQVPTTSIVYSDLMSDIVRARSELLDQYTRISTELMIGIEYTNMSAHTVLDVCSKLSEGPLRRVGAIFVSADRVVQGVALRVDAAEIATSATPAKIIAALGNVDISLVAGLDQLNRNAEAHYDYEIVRSEVRIRHIYKGQTSYKTATIDDLIAEAANLSEIGTALLLAAVTWFWELKLPREREQFRREWLRC